TNISHDLRTPLTAVSAYLDLLEREEKSENAEKYLEIIRGRTEAMKQLTEELFRYTASAFGSEMTYEKIDLNSILEESLAEFYGAITGQGIDPVIEISETPVERYLDRTALKRILGNIISNAVKYSSGDLIVRLYETGEMTFSNTAPGLDPVLTARLFDRFYTAQTGNNFTGLGLSIAKLLTEQMGGEISAEYSEKMLTVSLIFSDGRLL
ncbi:MAG: HAMP domain-containing histidine kinase, partial [Oscillospiraceae bacterium]|nr:HAMP domain-containing histidine kinase [Oscillospiraceae bacterium]